jgi:Cu/Ag efflux pump CusA
VALTLSFALLGGLILTLTLVPTLLSFALNKDMAERRAPGCTRCSTATATCWSACSPTGR